MNDERDDLSGIPIEFNCTLAKKIGKLPQAFSKLTLNFLI